MFVKTLRVTEAERAAVFVWSGPEVHQNRGRAPARPGPQGTERETISV